MPLTPFHLGPALLLGLLFFKRINFPTFIIANIILDIEPLIVLVLGLNYPLHGFLHSFLGASIVAIVLSLVVIGADEKVWRLMSFFKLEQKPSPKSILLASFSGAYLHILFDSPLYADIKPLFPITVNPLYNSSVFAGFEIYSFCVILFVLGIAYAIYGISKHRSPC